ncbi:MAG: hypothetical protein HY676_00030 [Chloroflexi bacterium]|nr:hypothetical protein [Chloroflexota bacterium]
MSSRLVTLETWLSLEHWLAFQGSPGSQKIAKGIERFLFKPAETYLLQEPRGVMLDTLAVRSPAKVQVPLKSAIESNARKNAYTRDQA